MNDTSKKLIHGSLFSGIGGFDLASEWIGWENAFHCEWNEFGQRILKYYWPNAKSYGDITKTDFTIWRGRIDVLTGGFPCQPYSLAGKRLGKEDERHLWPEMLRAIREIQPRFVVGENVYGLVNWNGGLVFDEVQSDLEAEGYEVIPFVLPACGKNAPHKRERVWFVAYRSNSGTESLQQQGSYCFCKSPFITNPENIGLQFTRNTRKWGTRFENYYCNGITSDTTGIRQSRKEHRQEKPGWIAETGIPDDWSNFPTQSPICNGDDGISERLVSITFPKWRNESIKAGGNAIVPQIAFEIFKAIQKHNDE